jgi:SpoVK/Ycf46/Vps4 family AAA+-type ATPase
MSRAEDIRKIRESIVQEKNVNWDDLADRYLERVKAYLKNNEQSKR